MYSILLFVHVVLALITLVASFKVVIDVRRQPAESKRGLLSMWVSFIATMVTGTALIVVVPSSLGHACVLMSLYVVVVTGVQLYQKHAVAAL
jgi:uncharacterized membrane protein